MDYLLNKYCHEILSTINFIAQIQDVDLLLERILTEARRLTNADAGSIYKKESNFLHLKYAQNETREKDLPPNKKLIYETFSFPIDESSIAGYVATTKKTLNIDDVYAIPEDLPYKFNKQVDKTSNYRTKSMLTLPLLNPKKEVLGVLQLINAKDPSTGEIIPFHSEFVPVITFLGECASIALERASLLRTIVLRMIKMAELRDPKETGTHVNRVGEYSAILYEAWAYKNNIPEKKIDQNKDIIRIAAMLHDVGKVAISDTILKKESKLTDEEYEQIKTHTFIGAKLFENPTSEIEKIARLIALEHHERWDGCGYPGKIEEKDGKIIKVGSKKGEEISIWGRIVCLADVFDALSSKRCYKDMWPEEKVLEEIARQKGKQFDPLLVDIFFENIDLINMAKKRYSEHGLYPQN
ncbi:HD domain-containing phosphohydrolase [Desulfothermus sp.]